MGQINLHRHYVGGVDAQIDLQQSQKGPDQQARARKQHQSQSYFRNHQAVAQMAAPGLRGRSIPAIPQGCRGIGAQKLSGPGPGQRGCLLPATKLNYRAERASRCESRLALGTLKR